MLKDILQEDMRVRLRNGSILSIHRASNGLYIIDPKSNSLIRIPEDYNNELICDDFYSFTIDGIYRNFATIEPNLKTVGYQLVNDPRNKIIWERNETKVAINIGVVEALKQINHLQNLVIETVFCNVKFNSNMLYNSLEKATSTLFETSHKADVNNG